MELSHAQRILVEDSFDLLIGREEEIGTVFYTRLFEIAPELKPLFTGDHKMQATKFLQMLSIAVHHLDAPKMLIPGVQALARRHVGYGTKPEHYQIVGEALLWTLKQTLSAAFTPAVESAWQTTYHMISTVMIEATYSNEPL